MSPLTDTQERLARITAEQAAQAVYERLCRKDKSFWRTVWNAIKHGCGIIKKEIDEAMKD